MSSSEDEQSTSSQGEDDRLYGTFQQACNEFFRPKRLGDCEVQPTDKPKELVFSIGEVYDITGFSAFKVIEVMRALINDSSRWIQLSTGKAFYFIIQGEEEVKMFKLNPLPTLDQPGNGLVSVMRRGKKAKRYTEIAEILAESETPATKCAEIIQMLFEDNSGLAQAIPKKAEEIQNAAIAELYFLLLFEIARRLSNKEDKTDRAKGFDELPIASVIARKLKLLAAVAKSGDAAPSLKTELESLFKCFTEGYGDREASIKEIIKIDAAGRPTLPESCKKELEEIFGDEVTLLANKLKEAKLEKRK